MAKKTGTTEADSAATTQVNIAEFQRTRDSVGRLVSSPLFLVFLPASFISAYLKGQQYIISTISNLSFDA